MPSECPRLDALGIKRILIITVITATKNCNFFLGFPYRNVRKNPCGEHVVRLRFFMFVQIYLATFVSLNVAVDKLLFVITSTWRFVVCVFRKLQIIQLKNLLSNIKHSRHFLHKYFFKLQKGGHNPGRLQIWILNSNLNHAFSHAIKNNRLFFSIFFLPTI